jgi:uncharacterized protein (TIGR02300 family)
MAKGTPARRILTFFEGDPEVAKPEWGTKRTCQKCEARFYDLKRTPIVCPKCGHSHDAEDFIKTRRSRSAPKAAAPVKKPIEKIVPVVGEAADDVADDALIEDAEDLEDDDDIEVVEPEDEAAT